MLQSALKSSGGTWLVTEFSMLWVGSSSYHLALPSFISTSTWRVRLDSEAVDSTPSSLRNSHSSRSTRTCAA